MNFVVLETHNEDTRFLDQSVGGAVARYGGHRVVTLDPCAIYERAGSAGLEAEIARAVRETRAEVFVCCAFGMWMELDPRFVYGLADCYRVYVVGDDEGHFDAFDRYNAQAYDLVISANPLVERYQQYLVDAEYYPVVYSTREFFPNEENRDKRHDVSFIGAVKGKTGREEAIAALERAGIAVDTWGYGTKNGQISAEGALSVYRRSRINLNFTGSARSPLAPDESIMDRVRAPKGRCTRVALCGSFVLSEYAPGLERQFDIGSEIDAFRDDAELVEKVRFYLTREQEREAMAAKAYARAVREYDEAKYWPAFCARLEQRALARRQSPDDRLPLAIDRSFWRVYGAGRLQYLVIFLFSGRLLLFFGELALLARAGGFRLRAGLWFAARGLHLARQRSAAAAMVAAGARTLRRLLAAGRASK